VSGDGSGFAHPLEPVLGHAFADPGLLRTALTHPSVGRAGPAGYERLEFLGDRVLGLVVAEMVYARFPAASEGALTRRLSQLVRRETLARVAAGLGLGDHVRLSRGEQGGGGRDNAGLLADCCEAVLGAVYLDGGLPAAAALIRRYWEPMIEEAATPPQDPRTALQEWAQGRGLPLPSYRTVTESGPPHERTFVIAVSVEGHEPAEGTGRSKRVATAAAAAAMMARLEAGHG
jgi:ribonuclease-3